MAYYVVKLIVTTLLIVLISEISKRSTFIAALLASVSLVSVLAMTWLYIDTKDASRVSALSSSVFWLVLPSLALFVVLPLLLKSGLNYYLSMGVSIFVTIACYWLAVALLKYIGISV